LEKDSTYHAIMENESEIRDRQSIGITTTMAKKKRDRKITSRNNQSANLTYLLDPFKLIMPLSSWPEDNEKSN
jgi:hypothetical protein